MNQLDVDVAMTLSYYAPYVSGLTDSARVVAEGLATRGWRITVITARHDPDLRARENLAGVTVVRTLVAARFGKGTISPQLPFTAARIAATASVLNVHLPMLEAGLITRAARATPVVATYQCDVVLPPGLFNRVQVRAVDASSRSALRSAAIVVASSADYAEQSRVWKAMRGRTDVISPPSQDRRGGNPTFRDGTGLHVGFLGRIVEEKGLEYLIDGFLRVARVEDRLLVGGDFSHVAGGSVIDKMRARAALDARIRFLGFLPESALADFYASLDVFALPSLNSLEAFGIVQVEAMMTGVPAIVSDLPGVRVPVLTTGFGMIIPPRSADAIGAAITRLRADPPDREAGASRTRQRYGAAATIDQYEAIFRDLGAHPSPNA